MATYPIEANALWIEHNKIKNLICGEKDDSLSSGQSESAEQEGLLKCLDEGAITEERFVMMVLLASDKARSRGHVKLSSQFD